MTQLFESKKESRSREICQRWICPLRNTQDFIMQNYFHIVLDPLVKYCTDEKSL